MARKWVPRGAKAVVAACAMCLAISACGDDQNSGTSGNAGDANGKKVAFLTASSANTYLAASKKEIDKIAEENGIEVTEFDAQFKPGAQSKQIQDVIASGQYDGIVIAALDGAGVIPDLEIAIEEGIEVAILNQVIGTELDTPDPQFEGPAVSVLTPPLTSGERLGALTTQACEGVDPCNVVYFYGIKGTPIDTATRQGFDEVTSSATNIKIVAEGEGKYLGPDESLKAMQDILQKSEDIDVVVGADQSIQGSLLALQDAGLDDKVKLIGFGGSEAAISGIKDGSWFGTVFLAPATEGKLAMEALVKALEDGTDSGGIDAGDSFPDEGRVTAENVDQFTPEWAG